MKYDYKVDKISTVSDFEEKVAAKINQRTEEGYRFLQIQPASYQRAGDWTDHFVLVVSVKELREYLEID
jgi:ADP-ribosylglycohydrolase